jgi:MEMO1 family protein
MNGITDVRPSPIAGTWYSGDPDRLREEIDHYLTSARASGQPGQVTAVVAPHAGHRYSGRTAGYAFASVLGRSFDLVAVISPMHAAYPATLLTSAHQAYETPLGIVEIDQQALSALDERLAQDGLSLSPIANDQEHSLEIELPFLQRAISGPFKLLPVMVRSQSPMVARRLGYALGHVLRGRRALMVASTDLSHFYPEEMAKALDHEMLRRIRGFSPDELFQAEKTGQGFACGVSAVAAVLWASRELGANVVEILHHSTSGDETGDHGSVVGYGAAAVRKQA